MVLKLTGEKIDLGKVDKPKKPTKPVATSSNPGITKRRKGIRITKDKVKP